MTVIVSVSQMTLAANSSPAAAEIESGFIVKCANYAKNDINLADIEFCRGLEGAH